MQLQLLIDHDRQTNYLHDLELNEKIYRGDCICYHSKEREQIYGTVREIYESHVIVHENGCPKEDSYRVDFSQIDELVACTLSGNPIKGESVDAVILDECAAAPKRKVIPYQILFDEGTRKFCVYSLASGIKIFAGDCIRYRSDAGKPLYGNVADIHNDYIEVHEIDAPRGSLTNVNFSRIDDIVVNVKEPADTKPSIKGESVDAVILDECAAAPELGASKDQQHYLDCTYQPVQVSQRLMTAEEFRGYCKGTIWGYQLRAGHKGSAAKDLGKAKQWQHWLDLVTANPDYMIDPIKDSL